MSTIWIEETSCRCRNVLIRTSMTCQRISKNWLRGVNVQYLSELLLDNSAFEQVSYISLYHAMTPAHVVVAWNLSPSQ